MNRKSLAKLNKHQIMHKHSLVIGSNR